MTAPLAVPCAAPALVTASPDCEYMVPQVPAFCYSMLSPFAGKQDIAFLTLASDEDQ